MIQIKRRTAALGRAALPFWRRPGMHPIRASIGGLLGLLVTALITRWALPEAGNALPYLIAPMGASAVLVFAVPAAPLAQPRAVIGGNFISALCGVAAAMLWADPILAAPIGAGAAILLMHWLRCLHPPGGAVALTAVIGGDAIEAAGFAFAIMPVAVNSLILVGFGILFNTLAGSQYPHRVAPSVESLPDTADTPVQDRFGFTLADVEAALDRLEDRPDIESADLAALFRAVEAQAFVRRHAEPKCYHIMSRDVVTCTEDATCAAALALLEQRHVSVLPVVTAQERVVGLVTRALVVGQGDRPVTEVMQTGACIARADSKAAALAPLLSDGIHHQAVVIWNNGSLAGIITQTDLLAALWQWRGDVP